MQLMPQTPHAWPALRDEVAVSLVLVPLRLFLLHSSKLAHFTLVSVESSEMEHTSDRPRARLGQVTVPVHVGYARKVDLSIKHDIN